MMYKILHLTKKENCDILIALLQEEKAYLEYRKQGLMMLDKSSEGDAAEIEAALQMKIIQMTAKQNYIDSLPDGKEKDAAIRDFKKLDYEKSSLVARLNAHGEIPFMQREYNIGCIEKRLEENAFFTQAVAERRNAI